MKQLTEYASSKARVPSQSDLVSSLSREMFDFGWADIDLANKAIDEAGIEADDVAEYLMDFNQPLNTIDIVATVYQYILDKVTDLLTYELDYDYPDSLCVSGNYICTSYDWEPEDQDVIIEKCNAIKDKPQFLKWFIEQIK